MEVISPILRNTCPLRQEGKFRGGMSCKSAEKVSCMPYWKESKEKIDLILMCSNTAPHIVGI